MDAYFPVSWVPSSERNPPPQAADWIVSYHPDDPSLLDPAPRLCRLSIARTAHHHWRLETVRGGYGQEHDADGAWFFWTAHELRLGWRAVAPGTDGEAVDPPPEGYRLRLTLRQQSFAAPQTLTVRIAGAVAGDQTFTVPATPEGQKWVSPPFVVRGDRVEAVFTGSSEPRQASAADTRQLSFRVGDAALEPVGP